MKIIEKIFPKGGYYITSGWGNRTYWLNGKQVSDFHNGIDYGTNGKKIAQYAVEDGYIISCGIDAAGGNAKFVWVAYPRIGKKFLHYHLDSIAVEKGQKVTAGTKLGTTGTTGWSTGIHLHLGMKDINGGEYQNVEEYDYQEPPADPFEGVSDEELAKRVWAGEFGNGEDRKVALGSRYAAVQALVDQGVGKPEEPKQPEKPAEPEKPKTTIAEGDIVIVNGTGRAASDGSGAKTGRYENHKMKVIGIAPNAKKPYRYALNQYCKGNIRDWTAVTAWFKEEDITK